MTKLTSKQIKTAQELLKQHDKKVVFVVVDGAHMYFDKQNALAGNTEDKIESVFASDEAKKEYEAELKAESASQAEKEAAAKKAAADKAKADKAAADKLKADEEAAAKKRDEEAAAKKAADDKLKADEEAAAKAAADADKKKK